MTIAYSVGVDIGGTFTDVVCRAARGATRLVNEVPDDAAPTRAPPCRDALADMRREWGIAPDAIARFVHGTTVATNAVIERKGARIGLLTTAGFKDVLEIGRQMRHSVYDLAPQARDAGVPGAGRAAQGGARAPRRPTGDVLVPLDEALGRRRASTSWSPRASRRSRSATCSRSSIRAHERRTREIVAERHPEIMVSLSSEVDPAFREYERTCVTAFDAYVKPVVGRYLDEHGAGPGGRRRAGAAADHAVARRHQLLAHRARQRPVRLFLSGPAAGVIGGLEVGRAAGIDDLITVDIGGTSCDIALIEQRAAADPRRRA